MSRGYGTELPIQNVRSSVVAESSADRELKNPTTGIADCCARAVPLHRCREVRWIPVASWGLPQGQGSGTKYSRCWGGSVARIAI